MPLPVDSNGRSIQVLAPSTSVILSPNASSVSSALPTGGSVYMISCSGDIWVKFGSSTVTAAASAGSTYIPGGVAYFSKPSFTGVDATHIAAFAAAAQTVCVTSLVV